MVRLTSWIRESAAARACAVLALVFVDMTAFMAGARAAQPRDWEIGFQPSATPVHQQIAWFHDDVLIPIITLITVFVLGLLVYVMVRFHHSRNPNPTRTSHNTVIEILWTVVPILILVFIAIPSFKLLYYMDRVPKADLTIKATGNQWFWHYDYPDQKIAFDSNFIPDKELKAGQLHLLSVDNPLFVPVGATVRVQVTGAPDGVIHSWFVPSFGVQEYAVPGRLNESWFRVEKPGTYYGECNQICGINHSKMPIEVKAVAQPEFEQWLGTAKKKFAAAAPANAAASDAAVMAAANAGSGLPRRPDATPADDKPVGN